VRRPVTALDCVLLKDSNLALALRKGPDISSRACLWVSPRPHHRAQCWFTNQRLIFLHISCLETLRSKKPQNRAAPCKLVGDLISLYSSMTRDPEQSHCMPCSTDSKHNLKLGTCLVSVFYQINSDLLPI